MDQAQSPWQPETDSSIGQIAVLGQQRGVPLPELPEISWSATEYLAQEKPVFWYGALGGAGLLVVTVVYLVTKDKLSSLVILLACIAVGVYAARKPESKTYRMNEDGIIINQTFYPYATFKSFSLVEEGTSACIWLKPLKRLAPIVAMYFEPQDEDRIVDMLSNFLPHEQKELDAIDRLLKKIRF